MNKPEKLQIGDKVAIVSLSSGMLGEDFCSHEIEIGVRRLREFGVEPVFMPHALRGISYLNENPQKRAEDLKTAFMDPEIKAIICAIGGDDTYRLLPYLMEDAEFVAAVHNSPKIFTGFSDTTINHLMLYQLGLQTYYGPCFICDLAELAKEMLPYTKEAFLSYFKDSKEYEITPSPVWYEEREDFSMQAIGMERIVHKEIHGYELLQGVEQFSGRLLGGCMESIYDILSGNRYPDEQTICEKYHLFPSKEEWRGKILFVESCEEKPEPELLRKELMTLKERGIFEVVNGVIVGKPLDEQFYEEYKSIYKEVIDNEKLPVLYNVNFGHSVPRTVLPYGAMVEVDAKLQKIVIKD